MIKGKPPYPFQTIALAVAFSPRLEALIAETRRLQELHHSKVVFIHVGKRTTEKQRQLDGYLNHYGFNDSNSRVFWEQGGLVETIIRICKLEVVDLLVIGALQRENVLTYYMGSVSREVSRKAKCSVLMITEPKIRPEPWKVIVVNGHEHLKTPYTLNTAIHIARKEGVSSLMVANEVDVPALAMSMADDSTAPDLDAMRVRLLEDETEKFNHLRERLEDRSMPIEFHALSGRSGHTIGQFARQIHADLLVVNSPDHHLSIFDRIFTHDLEYLLSDMPCNMLIVHSRLGEPLT